MTSAERPLILVISNYYLPGTRSGGGTRTIANTVERLSDRFRFAIITRGYDAGLQKDPYSEVVRGEWNRVGKATVFYLAKDADLRLVLKRAVGELGPSAVYANSFFSPLTFRSLRARQAGDLGQIPFILAPCGELSSGARSLKRFKKTAYVKAAVIAGLYSGIIWKASSEIEAAEIRNVGAGGEVVIAPDLPQVGILDDIKVAARPPKRVGEAKLVFLSRFDRKKNLKWLVENVRRGGTDVTLDIYGNIEDESYYREFLEVAKKTKEGIIANFKGSVLYEDVPQTFLKYHFKVLPTLGENFGHVVIESLSSGCPVLISDRTPWNDLSERSAGWVLPLEDAGSWQRAIDECAAMGADEYRAMSRSARNYAASFLNDPMVESATLNLLRKAIAKGKTGDLV